MDTKTNHLIYIIDDDADMVELLADDLEQKGYQVAAHTRVHSFFERFKTRIPDAIIVDMVIHEMPGWQIIKKIKNTHDLGNVKVIAISGILEEQDVRRMGLKADSYLEKPVSADTVDRILKELLL
ncbi:response regulator [bacterium]|nr:response regulator [bacterium]